MLRCFAGLALALTLASSLACGRDHGAARVRPLPKPDGSPALRGGGPPRSPRIASYKIKAALDAVDHRITAEQTLTWTNAGASAVDRLPFHLYLNGFKNESSLFMQSSRGRLRGARASIGGWGWIQISSVKLAGSELVGELEWPHAPDQSVVELPLPAPVEPGQTIELGMSFVAQLPEVFARTGYKGEFHLVGQWFPKIGVRVGVPGAERWECRPFHVNNEFFADFGSYDVVLTVPSTYVVAATGVLSAATESAGGTRELTYHAEDVHDFVWMADPYMDTMSGQAKVGDGTVEVRVLHRPEQKAFARRHLDAAVGAIERYSAWFAPYPWPIMTVIDPPVDAWMGAGGMEYQTLVTAAGDHALARPGIRLPEYVTIHEVGHNWFQGMLASNEPVEAWLDEGVNDWAVARVMNDMYGPRKSGLDWLGWTAEISKLLAMVGPDADALPAPIATAAFAFPDDLSYAGATYSTTARALQTLEQLVGPSKLAAAMKEYARQWVFKHPTGSDLFEVLSRELQQDLTWFFGPVFHSVGGLELGIRTASCRRAHPPRGVFDDGSGRRTVSEADAPDTGSYVCEVVVTSTGTIHVPVEIELRFADGGDKQLTWDNRGTASWQRFVVERSSRLVEVRLDPRDKLALGSPITYHHRLDGDPAAARRGAAWFASVAHTLLQLVGP